MLQCFVAMAIGQPETDRLFTHIRRNLKRIGVNAYRVDTVEHNNNIDKQILIELDRCDLSIADLTFARPSVYFEAGFAERRGIPVIYTCRKDHFKPQKDDRHGNLRVHFDLQMRNIIDWRTNTDDVFADRLVKRVVKVVAPLLRDNRALEKKREEEGLFERSAPWHQQYLLWQQFLKTVKPSRFNPRWTGHQNWVGARLAKSHIDLFQFMLLEERQTPKDIVRISQLHSLPLDFYRTLEAERRKHPQRLDKHLVLASVHPLSDTKLRDALRYAVRTPTNGFAWEEEYRWIGNRSSAAVELPYRIMLDLLPKLRSPRDLSVRLRGVMGVNGLGD